jgi:hypothetical protein
MIPNICLCGAQAGYSHRPGCPYPLYHASEAQAKRWQQARDTQTQRLPGSWKPVPVRAGTILRLLENIDLLDRGVIPRGTLVQVVHDAHEYLLAETFDRPLCFPVLKGQGIFQPLDDLLAVWHRDELIYWSLDQPPPSCQILGWPDQYELVAEVRSDSLESAYQATQHLDRQWWLNHGVQLKKRSRSTSCGDIITIGEDHRMVVAPTGFRWLDTEQPRGITEKPVLRNICKSGQGLDCYSVPASSRFARNLRVLHPLHTARVSRRVRRYFRPN